MIVVDFLTSWKTGFQEPSPLTSSNFVYHVIQMVLYNSFGTSMYRKDKYLWCFFFFFAGMAMLMFGRSLQICLIIFH